MVVIIRIPLLLTLLLFSSCSTGTGPDPASHEKVLNVSAGPDDSVYQNEAVYLAGMYAGSGKPDSLVRLTWRQVSGPAQSTIYDSASTISDVTFSRTGVYLFTFTVSYQNHVESDSTIYTVLDSLPFKILSPKAGDAVVIGDSTLISWQIVTPVQALALLSIDNGKSYSIQLNASGTSLKKLRRWMWMVDPALAPGDSCRVRIQDYSNKAHCAQSETFSLVNAR